MADESKPDILEAFRALGKHLPTDAIGQQCPYCGHYWAKRDAAGEVRCDDCGLTVADAKTVNSFARLLSAREVGGEAVPEIEVDEWGSTAIVNDMGKALVLTTYHPLQAGSRLELDGSDSPWLSRAQVAALLPLLVRFVETGRLAPDAEGNADGSG